MKGEVMSGLLQQHAGLKVLGLAGLLLNAAVVLKGQVSSLKEYPVPNPYQNDLGGITAGPDGALWFTNYYYVAGGNGTPYGQIGRMTTAGTITAEYPLAAGSIPGQIVAGPDGALWFVETNPGKIGRITTAGVITEYFIPTADSQPLGITLGPDGALWFTEVYSYVQNNFWYQAGKVGRITTTGIITEYPSPISHTIAPGSDGALWFAIPTNNCGTPYNSAIGRMTTTGSFFYYLVPTPVIFGIAPGPDGALWFTDSCNSEIGRITTSGVVTEYPTPTHGYPALITGGPDGALWFTDFDNNTIGRITTTGVITEYPVPTPYAYPNSPAIGPDGNIWFTEYCCKVGQVVLSTSDTTKPVSHVSPLPASEPVANFLVQWSGTDTGSGVHIYTVYVSDNAGPFTVWLTTLATQAPYPGVLGHTYRFYSIATDWAGNQENPKTVAEATTYVAEAPGDLNGDGAVNCADINVVMASFGKTVGQPGYNPVADVNHDGIVNVKDLSWVSQYLPPGTQCPH
jgi:virginiamycin B lyase